MKRPGTRMPLLAFVVAGVVAVMFALTVACGGSSQPSAATPAQTETPVELAPEITPTALLRSA